MGLPNCDVSIAEPVLKLTQLLCNYDVTTRLSLFNMYQWQTEIKKSTVRIFSVILKMALLLTIFSYFSAKTVLYMLTEKTSVTTNWQQKSLIIELTGSLLQPEIILTVNYRDVINTLCRPTLIYCKNNFRLQ